MRLLPGPPRSVCRPASAKAALEWGDLPQVLQPAAGVLEHLAQCGDHVRPAAALQDQVRESLVAADGEAEGPVGVRRGGVPEAVGEVGGSVSVPSRDVSGTGGCDAAKSVELGPAVRKPLPAR